MRGGGHQLGLCDSTRFSRSSDDSPQPLWATNSDGTDDSGDYAQGGNGQNDMISPTSRLAHELHGDSFSEKGQQSIYKARSIRRLNWVAGVHTEQGRRTNCWRTHLQ